MYLQDDEILKKISLYQISMYGYNEQEYYKNTQFKDGWSHLMKSINKLNDVGCNYHVSVVVNKKNYKDIERYIQSAIAIGAKKIIFGTQTPIGRAMSDNTCLSSDDFAIAYKLLKIAKRNNEHNIEIEEWSHRGYNIPGEELQPLRSYQGLFKCGSGTSHFVVSQSGKVRPCELLPEEYFDLGGLEVIQNAIDGKYLDERIFKKAQSFDKTLKNHGKNCSMFCGPLERLLNQINPDNMGQQYDL